MVWFVSVACCRELDFWSKFDDASSLGTWGWGLGTGAAVWVGVRDNIYMGRLRLARAGWMGRWCQVVGVEGKKEGGELSLKKVCFSWAAWINQGDPLC
jgi:hypothetical protein